MSLIKFSASLCLQVCIGIYVKGGITMSEIEKLYMFDDEEENDGNEGDDNDETSEEEDE